VKKKWGLGNCPGSQRKKGKTYGDCDIKKNRGGTEQGEDRRVRAQVRLLEGVSSQASAKLIRATLLLGPGQGWGKYRSPRGAHTGKKDSRSFKVPLPGERNQMAKGKWKKAAQKRKARIPKE